ncbi:NUDIX domain-containing protein [Jatrophihabitans endophyticus]|uniref:NUDIX domain-containing protein n=1 Tax=Jatrophihabitans endophyticus TaxID=1206085 RepID=A0A1M5I9R2_9ACTN|nr:NUDIX hydrolase [Jatrophihabitans endophyticus]SHG24610.1 NUDIX domain-containing protein [Jatrophihabitans endophyticus]
MSVIRTISSREVFRSDWLRLREDEVEFPNGSRGRYAVVDKQDFVLVLAREDDGFWLVEQYRYPIGRREWEFVQGGWPAGGSGTPRELAEAELREETGHRAGSLTHLGRLHAAVGFCSQGYDVFLATDLVAGEPEREATESDMVARWHSDHDVTAMVRDGRLADAHSVAAFGLWRTVAEG